jgi:hypothetical protein
MMPSDLLLVLIFCARSQQSAVWPSYFDLVFSIDPSSATGHMKSVDIVSVAP